MFTGHPRLEKGRARWGHREDLCLMCSSCTQPQVRIPHKTCGQLFQQFGQGLFCGNDSFYSLHLVYINEELHSLLGLERKLTKAVSI